MLRIYTALQILIFCVSVSTLSAQEREWSLDSTEQDAFLVFGTPNTDDVGISFWCKHGGRQIRLFVPQFHVSSKKVVGDLMITIDTQSFRRTAEFSKGPEANSVTAETELSEIDPAILALVSSNHFSITSLGVKKNFPFDGSDLGDLIKLCRTPKTK